MGLHRVRHASLSGMRSSELRVMCDRFPGVDPGRAREIALAAWRDLPDEMWPDDAILSLVPATPLRGLHTCA